MKLFKSIKEWLFSEERQHVKNLIHSEVSEIKNFLREKKEDEKFIKSLRLVGNTIIVVLQDGSTFQKDNCSKEFFDQLKEVKNYSEFSLLFFSQKKMQTIEDELEKESFKEFTILKGHPDFIVDTKNEYVYYKNISLPVPNVIAAAFVEVLEKMKLPNANMKNLREVYEALSAFWFKLALNPLAQSREDILLFIRKNDIRITRLGNMVLYRRIVSRKSALARKEYFRLISTAYAGVKKSKKSPKNYVVYVDGGKHKVVPNTSKAIIKDTMVGTLYDVYHNLEKDDSNDFTAAHDSSVNIKIGGVYSIPEDKINLNNGLCAAGGLHAASVNYNYSGFGDTPVVVLVSPSKAITVPTNDWGKLRTTEMFIVCVNNKPQGVHFEDDVMFSFDEDYHNYSIAQLEEAIKSKSFEPVSIKDETPELKMSDLKNIQEYLKTRIKSHAISNPV
jgi:hypothetical protein